jgi:hypothetical protein
MAAVVLFAISAHALQQEKPATGQEPENYRPLVDEWFRLQTKLEQGVQFPPPRTQSKLLALVPAATAIYVSLPNFGEAVGQTNQIFHQELQESPVLSDWWTNKAGMVAPMVEEGLAKFQELNGYLGDEIIVSFSGSANSPSPIVLAEIRKPGLKAFLQQLVDQYAGKSNAPVVLYSPAQLLATTHQPANKPLMILVRPDLVIAAADLKTLKSFNAHIATGGGKFAATPFGARLAQAYRSGAGVLAGVDMQWIRAQSPQVAPHQDATIQQSGFADLQYIVMDGKYSSGMLSTNAELVFKGPRQGMASWLAAPAPMGALDFVSSDASLAAGALVKNLPDAFDDVVKLAGAANGGPSMDYAQLESELQINLKEDLLKKLGGHLVIALDGPILPSPAWKVVLQVSDSSGLQNTFKRVLATANAKAGEGKEIKLEEHSENGVTLYGLRFGDGQKKTEIGYAFADGYLIVAASQAMVKEAIAVHRNGRSLAKSTELRVLMPRDQPNGVSALIYQNVMHALGPVVQQQSPDMADLFQQLADHSKPSLATASAGQSTIQLTGVSHGFDVNMSLLMAAITIPNLMKSRTAANESAAVAGLRTLSVAQAQYETTYPSRGFAADLATLGPGPDGVCDTPSEKRACMIDAALGCASESGCVKNGFRFTLAAICEKELCSDYVIVATPADGGGKSFCSSPDAVIRSQSGAAPASLSASECRSWDPLN